MAKKASGFTLIELIVVVLILGILAATAVPRFMSMGGAARASTMEALEGSVKAAAALAHSKYLMSGQSTSAATATFDVDGDGTAENFIYGYPAPSALDDILDMDGFWIADDGAEGAARFVTEGWVASNDWAGLSAATNCVLLYAPPASSGATPTYTPTNIDEANCN